MKLLLIITLCLPFVVNANWQEMSVQIGCRLITPNGAPAVFPGNYCIFMNDGSLISGTMKNMRRISSTKSVLWEKEIPLHHQMNLSLDGKKILTLSSEAQARNGNPERDDVLLVMDLEGNILNRRSAYEILKEAGVSPLIGALSSSEHGISAKFETSHFNSIYEIPENKLEKKFRWAKAGNIVVNSLYQGIFILSPDLAKVLYFLKYPNARNHRVHDVQLSPSGEFLLFVNEVVTKNNGEYSAIHRFDPVKNKVIFEYTSSPKEMFYSPVNGTIQEYDDVILFSHFILGGYVYSPSKMKILKTYPPVINLHGMAISPEAKFTDTRDFLSKQH